MEDTTAQPPEEPAPEAAAEAAPEPAGEVRRLVRVRDGRWFGGVCAGLGRYFDVSPTIYRIVFGALAFAGGAGILLYIAAWLVIPDEREDASVVEQALRDHRERPGLAIGVGLLGLAAVVAVSHAAFWPNPGNLWLAAVLAGAALVWWELRARTPAPASSPTAKAGTATTAVAPTTRRPSLFLPVVGLLLAGAGVLGVLEALDVNDIDLRIVLAAAVLLVGAAIAGGAAASYRVTGLVGLGLLLLAALSLALLLHVPFRGGVGDRAFHPSSLGGVSSHYRMAAGDMTVDLSDVSFGGGTTRVDVSLGVGELRVYVPYDVTVEARGEASTGNVRLFGDEENGIGVDHSRNSIGDGDGVLVLHTEVGVGDIRVSRR